ncbi:transketolase [Carbonactinospora thermoautotrophica]|uniref:Transketolase n=2 Tax=Carbonactinospora thermoautotrophica TaxID=1469144 RepID=A0A132MP01_9ACTN|nr:transketolase [Carbonactinospora thermoautotrophica]KWW99586.1 Transketolase [Carbonactinospora thermoautotrophica]KWX04029.1 transketolase [Carbonactinospora thermoautotrophica]
MPEQALEWLAELGQQLRVDSVRCSAAAGSGHPTSSMSAADLAAVLLARYLRYDFDAPDDPRNDHLIFSKGHASPLLYAMFKAAGAISDEELLTFRRLGSRLEGHPTPRLPWVDVATGSLGQGLPIGVGIALAGQRLDRLPYRVWVLCGDSELAEGSMWEAFEHAGYAGLDNLTAIVDVNRLGQRGPTRHGWDTAAYARRIGAFGWHTIEIDGHDVAQIDRAYAEALATSDRPTAILARTKKGKGVPEVENREGAHGKPLPDPEEAIDELGGERNLRVRVKPPEGGRGGHRFPAEPLKLPAYAVGDKVATRTAFGEALAALGAARPDVVVLDAEVSDSTRTEYFADAHPERFFQCYIAEQQMVAAAVGLRVRGWTPYAATFAAFLTRAYDFIRMAAVSRADVRLVGSHAGVSIGHDGPSQMGLEDLAAFRAVHGSTVLYPCDANQTAQLVAAMADLEGISYLRTTRGNTRVIYRPGEEFPVGGSRLLRASPEDRVAVVAAGITVHEALAAADQLAAEGIPARVIDLYSVKPVDAATLREAARDTGRLITVEDHWPEGGLGDAVLEALADTRPAPRVVRLAVRAMPTSATPAEQLHAAGIDAAAITAAARLLAA